MTTREKLETTILVLLFPALVGLAVVLLHAERKKDARKRLADLSRAEAETGCD
jgi:hypothetical protein